MFEQGDEGRLHVGRLAPKAPIKQNEGRIEANLYVECCDPKEI